MRDIIRYIKILFSWQGNPIFICRFDDSVMGHLHQIAASNFKTKKNRSINTLIKYVLTLTWPLRLIWQSLILAKQYGAGLYKIYGIPRSRQILDMVQLGLCYGMPPLSYYDFRFFMPERKTNINSYLYMHEIGPINSFFSEYKQDEAVEDKIQFALHCKRAGLPCVETVVSSNDYIELNARLSALNCRDLISKPAKSFGGRGVELWKSFEEHYVMASTSEIVQKNSLPRKLTEIYKNEPWIVQSKLENHESLEGLSPGSLITVRMMTAYLNKNDVRAFAGLLKMPINLSITNNSGIGSNIDMETGILAEAFAFNPLYDGFIFHPTTNKKILGRSVPYWREAVELAIKSHTYFNSIRLLGWDIALTPQGPILLEANFGWDVTLPQMAMQSPLGKTNFYDIAFELLSEISAKN